MKKTTNFLYFMSWIFAGLLLVTGSAVASNPQIHPDVAKIVAQSSEPDGVVIDIETLNPDGIKNYLSTVQTQVATLRNKFADLDIVVISHGLELIAFLKPEAGKQMTVEAKEFKAMMDEHKVVLHICETSASWQGYLPEDFLDFVDTVPSGLATINDYKALDYVLVPIEQLTDKQREVIMNMREQD